MNKTGNMKLRTGRYKGSIQEKRDRLEFQKHILDTLKIARKARTWAKDPNRLDTLIEEIRTNYLKEKLAIERDY